ncbi:MAG: HAD family hydrolase [candidate division Zixibacteria bacterium]|nr:HAD family hydrolase [candidate division Zixibacteria bacterium]
MKKLKGIIFDMGSTLLEFENSSWVVLGKRSAERSFTFLKDKGLIDVDLNLFTVLLSELLSSSFELSEQNLEEFRFEDLAEDIFRKLDIELQDGNYDGFLNAYYQPVTEQLTLIDSAVETLRYFKEEGYIVGLISNTIFPARYHLKELERFGLLPYFDSVLFSSEVGYKKPHPEIFIQALKRLKVEAEESVFIGDKLIEDVGGAKNLGMRGILKYKEGRDYTAPIIPDKVIKDLVELPEVIRNFNRGLFIKEKI